MPELKVSQDTARKELNALKQLPTKDMTETQQKIWERLVNPDANGNRLLDIYYNHIADYERNHLRNVKLFNWFKNLEKTLLSDKNDREGFKVKVIPFLNGFFHDSFEHFRENKGRNPISLDEFRHYLNNNYAHEYPEKREEFYKVHPDLDAAKVIPPSLKAHVDEYLKNKAEGKINIIKNAADVKKAQATANRDKVIAKKAKSNRPLTDMELEAILYGNAINVDDNHTIKSNALNFGKGGLLGILINLIDDQDETNYKEIQDKRFKIMTDQIKDYPNHIKKQIAKGIIDEEDGFEDFECMYNKEQLTDYMNSLSKNESYFKMPKVKTLTEAFYELVGKRLDSQSLKEDDSPADFASGLNSAVTANSGVDMSPADTSTSSSSSTTSSSTSSSPDFDYVPDSGDSSGGFGGISGPSSLPTSTPDDDSEGVSSIPQGEYKVVDILVNDKDTSLVKVKIQNTETKEIETVDLSDIDV